MTLEAEQQADVFQILLEEARIGREKEIEIASFTKDTVSPFKSFSSRFKVSSEEELNIALTEFVQNLVPEGENKETLEKGFEDDPDRIIHHSHHDEIVTEWNTVIDNIVIGIKAITDGRSESVRTWYLRSGEAIQQAIRFHQEEKGFTFL